MAVENLSSFSTNSTCSTTGYDYYSDTNIKIPYVQYNDTDSIIDSIRVA